VQRLHQTIASMPISVAGASTLTASELRVLAYLPTHLTLADIAERLGVTRHTIKSHAISIYGKLDAASRRSAVESAIDAGLLPASMAPGLSRTMVVEPGYGAPVDGTEARERPPGSG
jgi:LuxR family maltose regulon positive regulatory protein